MSLLDTEALARMAGLQLRVQTVVEGTLAGLHRSPHHGASIEFAEHKEYAPGDDLRHLDWKAYGKFDRYYIKRFEDETDLRAYLALDASGSMAYGAPLTKLAYGSVLLASLAYFLSRQGDQPGLVGFNDRVRSYIPPRARSAHMAELLSALEALTPEGTTDLVQAAESLGELMGHRALTVLVSDLFDPRPGALRALRNLRVRRNHVVLFHLLHPDELSFPFDALTIFQSLEDSQEILADPHGIRGAYLAEMERFLRRVRTECLEAEVEYHLISTAQPVHEVLLGFLRNKRGGQR